MNRGRVHEILSAFSGKRIVVVGDIMLDEYVWGKVNRISPEAPVMVVDAERYTQVPGGAANVVNNICALGAIGSIVGAIGSDEAGRQLTQALKSEGAETGGLVTTDDRPTTRKTRIIAHSQQVVRVDHERRGALSPSAHAQLVASLEEQAATADAFVLSDYQKGVVVADMIAACVRAAGRRGIPLTGNLKPRAINRDCQLTVLTLNLLEASQVLGVDTLETEEDIASAGRELIAKTGAQNVLITRGAQGLTLFTSNDPDHPAHVPARPVEVYDVAGAGDTVISSMTLALAAGASPLEAVTIANHAAAEAVKKVGVATVSAEEILASF